MKFHYFSVPIRIGYKMNNVIWSVGIDPSLFIVGSTRGPEISGSEGLIGYRTVMFNEGASIFQLAAIIECKILVQISNNI